MKVFLGIFFAIIAGTKGAVLEVTEHAEDYPRISAALLQHQSPPGVPDIAAPPPIAPGDIPSPPHPPAARVGQSVGSFIPQLPSDQEGKSGEAGYASPVGPPNRSEFGDLKPRNSLKDNKGFENSDKLTPPKDPKINDDFDKRGSFYEAASRAMKNKRKIAGAGPPTPPPLVPVPCRGPSCSQRLPTIEELDPNDPYVSVKAGAYFIKLMLELHRAVMERNRQATERNRRATTPAQY